MMCYTDKHGDLWKKRQILKIEPAIHKV